LFKSYRILIFFVLLLGLPIFSKSSIVYSDQLCNRIDCTEVSRTWESARTYIQHKGSIKKLSISELSKLMEGSHAKPLPLAIYLHGCAGLWEGSDRRGSFLAKLGFIVIAPDSFARKIKPLSCLPYQFKGGLHRGTLTLRQEEATYAIENSMKLDWIQSNKVILVGLSEGGITTATLKESTSTPVLARIIEGWGCHSGWTEYSGLNSPNNQPVMSFVGKLDPWFMHPTLQGDCGKFMKNDDSFSIVYSKTPLSRIHTPLDHKTPKISLERFLHRYVLQK
tara:strand:- start:245 stop:1081 length:837 start_codon:yes stop_codon:yes gene_type:complete